MAAGFIQLFVRRQVSFVAAVRKSQTLHTSTSEGQEADMKAEEGCSLRAICRISAPFRDY